MRLRATVVLSLLLALPGAAAADWLVVRGGPAVETQGPWATRGPLVVFRGADGELSSLRASEVDLEASQRVTQEAVTRAQAKAASAGSSGDEPQLRKKAVLVLTDSDFPRARAPEPAGEKPDSASGSSSQAPDRKPEALRVTSWEDNGTSDPPGLEVVGVLRNEGTEVAAQVRLTVILQDRAGGMVGSGQALLESTILLAGRETTFRASFPGIYAFQRPQFRTQSISFVGSSDAPE